jgi:hypothetical protein
LAHPRELFIQGWFGNLAFLYVHHQAIVISNEADVQSLFELVPLAADHDPVAVAIRLRARDNRFYNVRVKTTYPLEKIPNLFVLDLQLKRVRQVLILASAALPEIPALRHNPLGRTLDDMNQARASKTLFDLSDFRLHNFTHGYKRYEYDQIRKTRHAFTAEGNIFNCQGDFFARNRTHRGSLSIERTDQKRFLVEQKGINLTGGNRENRGGTIEEIQAA